MSESGQEIEAKYYVLRLDPVLARLERLQARLIQPRVLETNLRFDLPDSSLTAAGRVLRLRRDTQSRLTYKGPGINQSGVLDRQEIEFIVEDHHRARQFLEALGYHSSAYYEKYRTTFALDQALVMLDEMPYGKFVEIEGQTVEQVQAVSASLDLDRGAAIASSYMALFESLRERLRLPFGEISFTNFEQVRVTPEDLGVRPADK